MHTHTQSVDWNDQKAMYIVKWSTIAANHFHLFLAHTKQFDALKISKESNERWVSVFFPCSHCGQTNRHNKKMVSLFHLCPWTHIAHTKTIHLFGIWFLFFEFIWCSYPFFLMPNKCFKFCFAYPLASITQAQSILFFFISLFHYYISFSWQYENKLS